MLRVLVVEDEEMIRKGIVLTVDWTALDCVVVGEAANGVQGLEAARRLNPNLIITDLKMPQMDGIEMLRALRAEGCKAYVIILTAYDNFSYAQSALRLGAVDYLLSPFMTATWNTPLRSCKPALHRKRQSTMPESASARGTRADMCWKPWTTSASTITSRTSA